MRGPFGVVPIVIALLGALGCGPASDLPPPPPPPLAAPVAVDARAGIEAVNQAMRDATLRMDAAAIAALWEDDGVTMLPGEKPIVGKKAIFDSIDGAVKQLPGAKMQSFEMTCTGLEIAGDMASEYCDEHQVVTFANGDPPFDGRGKLLFVLHRGADGKWRLRREMWNQGPKK